MIRKLLATTAVAALMATGAYAQSNTAQPAADQSQMQAPTTTQNPAATQPETPMVIKAEGNLATNVIGKAVYNGTGDDAQKIGSVNDLVISPDGQIEALVIGVGGFLGIGQKDVAIEYKLAKWEERDNDRWLVVDTTADALKAQAEFDRQAYEPMPADADVAETKPATAEDLAKAPAPEQKADETASADQPKSSDQMAQAPATDSGAADQQQTAEAPKTGENADQQNMASNQTQTSGNAAGEASGTDNQMAMAPKTGENAAATDSAQQTAEAAKTDESANATDETKTAAIDRSKLKEQPTNKISADDFIGTTVYGANDEDVGEIGDVILSDDGKVDAVLVDVGGFLGIGEKQVALGMDNLQFMTDEDGDLYLYTSLTKDQLEAQAAYDEKSYAENRDEMRMSVPAVKQ